MSFEDLLADIDNPTPKKKNGGDGKTRWLGRVKLLATEGQQDQEYITTVAVWAGNREEFDQVLLTKIVSRHLTLLHCENAMPAVKWLYDYPGDYAALELAKGVFTHWPIAFGTLEKVEAPASEPESYLTITEHDIPALPEQKGIPFWDKEWIVPELKELLFAHPSAEQKLNTYLVVDATLRREITKLFDLDRHDLSIRCLFTGQSAKELKEVAPYLVDISLPEGAWEDKDKVPGFHKDFFENHWSKGTGILIKTAATIDELHHHLRKFTKIKNRQGKWYFFRFWDVQLLSFAIRRGHYRLLSPFFQKHSVELLVNQGHKLWHVCPLTNFSDEITYEQLYSHFYPVFEKYKLEKTAEKVVLSLQNFLTKQQCASTIDIVQIENLMKKAQQQGFISQLACANYAAAHYLLGSDNLSSLDVRQEGHLHENTYTEALMNEALTAYLKENQQKSQG